MNLTYLTRTLNTVGTMKDKTLLLLLDGASWKVLQPLISQGKAPYFEKIYKKGAKGMLDNLGEHKSPLIWTTIATGWTKEAHGVTDFTTFAVKHPSTGRNHLLPFLNRLPRMIKGGIRNIWRLLPYLESISVNSYVKEKKAIWEILSNAGTSVGVINWWCTYPASKLKGYMISDHANFIRIKLRKDLGNITLKDEELKNFKDAVFPRNFWKTITRIQERITTTQLKRIIREVTNLDENEIESCLRKDTFQRADPLSVIKFSIVQDLFAFENFKVFDEKVNPTATIMGIGGLDSICHYFWKYRYPKDFEEINEEEREKFRDIIEKYYIFLDRKIREIVNEGEIENTLVISDHGFESASKQKRSQGISGDHLSPPPGIFLGCGPNLKKSENISIKSIDVVPTLLYLLDLPIGRDMPGKVKKEIFKEKFRKSNPTRTIKSWETYKKSRKSLKTSQVEQEVKERLKALGYIKE